MGIFNLQLNRGKSNNKRVTFVCSTSVGKAAIVDGPHKCDYVAVLRYSAKASEPLRWALSKQTTNAQHSALCLSKAKITFKESQVLTHNTADKRYKGSINDTRNKIAAVNNIAECNVPTSVANRLRVTHTYADAESYDENWLKMDEWGRQLVQRNEGLRSTRMHQAHVPYSDGHSHYFKNRRVHALHEHSTCTLRDPCMHCISHALNVHITCTALRMHFTCTLHALRMHFTCTLHALRMHFTDTGQTRRIMSQVHIFI